MHKAAEAILLWGERQEPLKLSGPPQRLTANRRTARGEIVATSGKIARVQAEKAETAGKIMMVVVGHKEITQETM